jgi:hypothetical protein
MGGGLGISMNTLIIAYYQSATVDQSRKNDERESNRIDRPERKQKKILPLNKQKVNSRSKRVVVLSCEG